MMQQKNLIKLAEFKDEDLVIGVFGDYSGNIWLYNSEVYLPVAYISHDAQSGWYYVVTLTKRENLPAINIKVPDPTAEIANNYRKAVQDVTTELETIILEHLKHLILTNQIPMEAIRSMNSKDLTYIVYEPAATILEDMGLAERTETNFTAVRLNEQLVSFLRYKYPTPDGSAPKVINFTYDDVQKYLRIEEMLSKNDHIEER